MNNSYTIEWLGYNKKSNFNRVWGHIKMRDNRHYVFWGVKGKKMEFKRHKYPSRIAFIIKQNEAKGYNQIHPDHYEIFEPNFIEDVEIWFMAHVLQEE